MRMYVGHGGDEGVTCSAVKCNVTCVSVREPSAHDWGVTSLPMESETGNVSLSLAGAAFIFEITVQRAFGFTALQFRS